MASVASQLIEEVTAHAQSDSLEDAREICADGTYFPNNLRNFAPDDGWRDHPKHVEQFTDNINCAVASGWTSIDILSASFFLRAAKMFVCPVLG